MSDFVFIYGKNPALSLAEIVSYLKFRGVEFKLKEHTKDFGVFEVDLPEGMMERLGGTIKIGRVIFSGDAGATMDEVEQGIDFVGLFENLPGKVEFGVSAYGKANQRMFSSFLKKKMQQSNIKATYMAPPGRNALTHVEVIKKGMIEGLEVLACSGEGLWLAKTVAVHNPFEFQKRDMKRPVERPILSIPPRLCRIMINLSGRPEKDSVLLDPFCGIGSILQEAVLMGYDVRGIDIDRKCIRACVKNLTWIGREYGAVVPGLKSKVRHGDARLTGSYFKEGYLSAVVTEPYLGPALKKKPEQKVAKKIAAGVESLYRPAIAGMLKSLKKGGRIVIVSPRFQTKQGIVRVDIEKIAEGLGGVMDNPLEGWIKHSLPFTDFEERHKTIREIHIIRKP